MSYFSHEFVYVNIYGNWMVIQNLETKYAHHAMINCRYIIWVMKAASVISRCDSKILRFQEVYLVTWYEERYIQVCNYSVIYKKSKVK